MNLNTIGSRIRHLRQQEGLSMDELARKVRIPLKDKDADGEFKSITSAAISNIENEKSYPSAEVIIALSDFFNVSTDWILKGKEFIPNSHPMYDEKTPIKMKDGSTMSVEELIDMIDKTVTIKMNQLHFGANNKVDDPDK